MGTASSEANKTRKELGVGERGGAGEREGRGKEKGG